MHAEKTKVTMAGEDMYSRSDAYDFRIENLDSLPWETKTAHLCSWYYKSPWLEEKQAASNHGIVYCSFASK
ncbi:hypothetical protein VTL71DRAFT_9107 [Oculimacula yallundae]|uniref:Uncharacterized protein n=1 Tax=Oculimacula yallundae TaxID=86028 RepID=A0ABR4BTT1_9HELO